MALPEESRKEGHGKPGLLSAADGSAAARPSTASTPRCPICHGSGMVRSARSEALASTPGQVVKSALPSAISASRVQQAWSSGWLGKLARSALRVRSGSVRSPPPSFRSGRGAVECGLGEVEGAASSQAIRQRLLEVVPDADILPGAVPPPACQVRTAAHLTRRKLPWRARTRRPPEPPGRTCEDVRPLSPGNPCGTKGWIAARRQPGR